VMLAPDPWFLPALYHAGDAQWAWLQADLRSVDRIVTPWVIVMFHRALYCTAVGPHPEVGGECGEEARRLREGELAGPRWAWVAMQLVMLCLHVALVLVVGGELFYHAWGGHRVVGSISWPFRPAPRLLGRDRSKTPPGPPRPALATVTTRERSEVEPSTDEALPHMDRNFRNREEEPGAAGQPRLPLRCWLSLGMLCGLFGFYSSLSLAYPELFPGLLWWHLRLGALGSHWGLEELLLQHRVDLVLGGHTHIYERTKPLYKGRIQPEGKAPVYIVAGGASFPSTAGFNANDVPSWSAYRDEQARYC